MTPHQSLPYKRKRQEEKDARLIPQKRIAIDCTSRTAEPQYANDIHRPMAETQSLLDRVGHGNKPFQQQTSGSATITTTGNLHDYITYFTSHISQEEHTMNSWLGEWETASGDLLPSNIRLLCLLISPTGLNLGNNMRGATEVQLIHYCPEMVPKGRVEQELRLGEEQDDR